MKRLLFAFAILLVASVGANSAETSCAGSPCLTAVPTSATAVVSTDVRLGKAVFSNTTAGALTITVSDQSTNCSAGVCDFLKSVSIAANTTYTIDFMGAPASGGFKWSASNTGVVGWISWGRQ